MVKILWVDDEIELLKPHVLLPASERDMKSTPATTGTTRSTWPPKAADRPDHPRRDDARHDRTGNASEDQGGTPHHARHHGDQERGGEHHGQGRSARRSPTTSSSPSTPTRYCCRSRRTSTSSSSSPSRRRPTTASSSAASPTALANGRQLLRLVQHLPAADHLVGHRVAGVAATLRSRR